MRFLFTIFAFIYLCASIGATLHLHYCMGRIAGVDLLHSQEKVCGLCGMEKPDQGTNNCCKDEAQTIKISIDQKTNALSCFHFEQPFTDLLAGWVPVLPEISAPIADKAPPVSHAPPRSKPIPEYLMYSVFLI